MEIIKKWSNFMMLTHVFTRVRGCQMAVNVIHILRVSTQNTKRGPYTLGGKYVKETNYPNPRNTKNQEAKG
jgi:hypothetical protein